MQTTTNIRPAHRVEEIKEYYFSRKLREIAMLREQGVDVISLGIGGPDLPPPTEVTATMCRGVNDPSAHGYQPHVGLPELRREFAQWYKRWYGVTLNPATEFQPLIGSKEGVMHISLAFLNPGDGVLVPDPGYPTYSSVSKLVGAEIFTYPLTREGEWQPDFDALEKLPLDRIKMMWLNYPHMPTGAPARMSTFRKAVDFARRHNILLVHDNPYSFILNPTPMSIMQVDGAKDVVIEMNSLSKSHNMPGWRVGVAVSNPMFISWLLKVKSNIDSGQFKPLMLAAAEALRQPDEWHQRLNEEYGRRRQVAEQIMDALGCDFDSSQSGLFLWGRIRREGIKSEELADAVLEQANVFVTPGSIFGVHGEGYIRLSLCTPVERLQEALERIINISSTH